MVDVAHANATHAPGSTTKHGAPQGSSLTFEQPRGSVDRAPTHAPLASPSAKVGSHHNAHAAFHHLGVVDYN